MARQIRINIRMDGRSFTSLGGMFESGISEYIATIQDGASRNINRFMDFIEGAWVRIVQESTWISPVPAPRNTIIVERSLSTRTVKYGWDNFNRWGPQRFLLRSSIMDEIMEDVLKQFSLGTDSEVEFSRVMQKADSWLDVQIHNKVSAFSKDNNRVPK